MKHLKIGISIGDINGIGLEVILKTLANQNILKLCIPIIYGSSKVVSYHKNIVDIEEFQFNGVKGLEKIRDDRINIVNCWQENVNITLGKLSDSSGEYAFKSLEMATKDLTNGLLDALVTAPINKNAMKMIDFPFPGHTEYLAAETNVKENLMLMVSDQLRIAVATGHIPLSEVASTISKELVAKKLDLLHESLKMDFGIERPTIAVLGLNPHAGDNGIIGDEEEKKIRPAIIEAKKNGMIAMGPYSADGFFGSGQYTKFDGILAMYHDQGLVPFKTLSFGKGVNFTAGLPVIRTSPDHGTAYEIAGKNAANPSSFRQALFLAIDIAKQRKEYFDARSNPLSVKSNLQSEEG